MQTVHMNFRNRITIGGAANMWEDFGLFGKILSFVLLAVFSFLCNLIVTGLHYHFEANDAFVPLRFPTNDELLCAFRNADRNYDAKALLDYYVSLRLYLSDYRKSMLDSTNGEFFIAVLYFAFFVIFLIVWFFRVLTSSWWFGGLGAVVFCVVNYVFTSTKASQFKERFFIHYYSDASDTFPEPLPKGSFTTLEEIDEFLHSEELRCCRTMNSRMDALKKQRSQIAKYRVACGVFIAIIVTSYAVKPLPDISDDAYDSGYEAGLEEGRSEGLSEGYNNGYSDGLSDAGYEDESPASSSDAVVYVTPSGSKYHTSSCSYLGDNAEETTLSRAQAQGYTPCSKCHPPE